MRSSPSPQTHPPCLFPGLAEVDEAIAVDARSPEDDARASTSACSLCAHSSHRGSSHRHFSASPSPGDLGEHTLHKTLAEADLLACMQQVPGTMAISHRSPSNRTDRRPHTDSAAAGLAGEPAGPIWPRSGEARPDLAPFLFFPEYYLFN
jgi:hypothetical protein